MRERSPATRVTSRARTPKASATAARTAAVAGTSTALAATDTPSTSSSPQRPPTRVLEAPGRARGHSHALIVPAGPSAGRCGRAPRLTT